MQGKPGQEKRWRTTHSVVVEIYGTHEHASDLGARMQRRVELVYGVGRISVQMESVEEVKEEVRGLGRVGQGPAESDNG